MDHPKRIIATLAAACFAGLTSQVTAAVISAQGFEATPSDGWSYAITGSGGAVSTDNPATDTPASSRVLSGVASFQHTTAVNGSTTPSLLIFSAVDVSDFMDTSIEIRLAAISSTGGNGLDGPDNVQVFVALNGNAFSATPDLTITGAANARWTYAAPRVAETTVGTPLSFTGTSANGIGTLNLILPDGTTSAALQIVSTNDSNAPTGSKEIWAMDDISINGTPVPEPTMLGVLALGGTALLARRRNRSA